MIDEGVKNYIEKCRSSGLTDEQIVAKLVGYGWPKDKVLDTLNQLKLNSTQESKPLTGSHGMWDGFEHIILFFSLYMLAGGVMLLLNFYVDEWFKSVDTSGGIVSALIRDENARNLLLHGYMASIIVSLPVFCFLFLDTIKRTEEHPEIKLLKPRRILTYITLIATFLITFFKVFQLVNDFLNGNVTLNPFMHFVVTVLVSGTIFIYYLYQVKEDRAFNG